MTELELKQIHQVPQALLSLKIKLIKLRETMENTKHNFWITEWGLEVLHVPCMETNGIRDNLRLIGIKDSKILTGKQGKALASLSTEEQMFLSVTSKEYTFGCLTEFSERTLTLGVYSY